jgi:hypothetical protein
MEKVMKASLARIGKDNSLGEHNPLPPFFKGELPTHLEKEPKIMPLFGKEREGEIL